MTVCFEKNGPLFHTIFHLQIVIFIFRLFMKTYLILVKGSDVTWVSVCLVTESVTDTGTVWRERTSWIVPLYLPPVCRSVRDMRTTPDCAPVLLGPGNVTTICVWSTASGAMVCQSVVTCQMNPPRVARVMAACLSPHLDTCVME